MKKEMTFIFILLLSSQAFTYSQQPLNGLKSADKRIDSILEAPPPPQRREAQDFNTTRSNRERGQLAAKPGGPIGGIIVKGGKNPGANMQVKGLTNEKGELLFDIAESGSYKIIIQFPDERDAPKANINTSRSNIKQPAENKTTNPLYEGGAGGGANPLHELSNPMKPGGPLKGIDVKLGKNPHGGIQAKGITNENGEVLFDITEPGSYKITLAMPAKAGAVDFNTTRSNRERR